MKDEFLWNVFYRAVAELLELSKLLKPSFTWIVEFLKRGYFPAALDYFIYSSCFFKSVVVEDLLYSSPNINDYLRLLNY